MDVIRQKNRRSFDPVYGAITMTYFPINIILLPFVVFLVLMKSPRLSDFVLKLQYALLVMCYCLLGLMFSFAVLPIMYLR